MKKRIFSRVLALFMALAMLSTTALADVSFDDLQAAIDGDSDQKTTQSESQDTQEPKESQEPQDTQDTQEPQETPEKQVPTNGTEFKIDDQTYYGYGWNGDTNAEGQGWDIWAWLEDTIRNITVFDDVKTGTGENAASGITVGAEDGKVVINLNNHSLTGNGEGTVIEVGKDGDLTISQGTVTGGKTGINVADGGKLAMESMTVTGNDIGVAFAPEAFLTFTGDQNVVSKNTTNNLSGTGKVTFNLDNQEYKVDAKTAELLLAGEGSVAAHGKDWILAKNNTETYTVVYTGTGGKFEGTDNWLSEGIVKGILDNDKVSGKKVSCFIVSDDIKTIGYNAFANRKDIKEVQLKSGLTTIQKSAFSGCSGLETINIPETVTMINDNAFTNCAILEKIELPSGLTTLGHSVFKNCTNLKGVVTIPVGVTAIGNETFRGCASLEGITFAEDSQCTKIGVSAFYNCKGLTGTVVIPEGVTVIETSAFYGCTGLEGIQLKGNVTTINSSAFSSCSSLKSINIPATVTTIGNGAFGGCKELTSVELPEGLTTLGSGVFKNCANLTGTVTIPAGLTKIDNSVFYGCKSLEGVVFADNSKCTSIDDCAFYNCEGIKNIAIPEGVTTIKRLAFYLCRGLETVRLEEGVTSLGHQAFSGCPKLTSINIPKTVTSIEDQAFYMSRSLKTITIPTGVKEFGRQVFYDVKGFPTSVVKSVWIPSEEGSAETAALVASKTDVNIFVKEEEGNLSFYRGEVTVNLGHNADNSVNLDDGSVVLTNVSGTITGEREVTLPNVAGITASIDTDGKIIVNIPAGGEEYPYGATITVDPDDPDGKIEVKEQEAPDLPVISFDFDEMTADTDTTIDDQAVPLAGLVSRAQLVSYLYAREGSPDGEDAEDEYTLAWAWGVENEIVDEEDDPEEIVTVAIFREIMINYAELLNTTFDVVIEDEDDMPLMNCDEILAEFFASLEDKAA